MKKSFIIASVVGLCGLSMLQTACDNYDDLIPQEYNCILSLQQYGEQEIVLYRTGEDTRVEITTLKTGNVPTSTATATIKPMTEIEFAEYKISTGKLYKYLPQDCYTIEDGALDYASTDKWKKSYVSINFDKAASLVEQNKGEYVIPMLLASESDSCLSTRRELLIKLTDVVVPKVSMVANAHEVKNTGGIISVPLNLQIENQWDFRAKVVIDESTTTLQGISLISDEAKSASTGNEAWVNFTAGGNATLQVSISNMSAVSGTIGLKIVELEGVGFEFDEVPTVVNVKIEKYPLTPEMLSTNALEPTEGSLAALLDGNINTYFHSAWSVDMGWPHYVEVNLPEPVQEFTFSYTNRATNANAAVYWLDLYAGNDSNNLTKMNAYSWDSAVNPLPWNVAGGQWESQTVQLNEPSRVLRFVVTGSMGGNCFVWSEFSMRVLK